MQVLAVKLHQEKHNKLKKDIMLVKKEETRKSCFSHINTSTKKNEVTKINAFYKDNIEALTEEPTLVTQQHRLQIYS